MCYFMILSSFHSLLVFLLPQFCFETPTRPPPPVQTKKKIRVRCSPPTGCHIAQFTILNHTTSFSRPPFPSPSKRVHSIFCPHSPLRRLPSSWIQFIRSNGRLLSPPKPGAELLLELHHRGGPVLHEERRGVPRVVAHLQVDVSLGNPVSHHHRASHPDPSHTDMHTQRPLLPPPPKQNARMQVHTSLSISRLCSSVKMSKTSAAVAPSTYQSWNGTINHGSVLYGGMF